MMVFSNSSGNYVMLQFFRNILRNMTRAHGGDLSFNLLRSSFCGMCWTNNSQLPGLTSRCQIPQHTFRCFVWSMHHDNADSSVFLEKGGATLYQTGDFIGMGDWCHKNTSHFLYATYLKDFRFWTRLLFVSEAFRSKLNTILNCTEFKTI